MASKPKKCRKTKFQDPISIYDDILIKMDYGKYDEWNNEFGFWYKIVPNLKDICYQGVHLRLLAHFKTGQNEKAAHLLETIWKKFAKGDILKLFHDFNDEISRKFGSSYVIIDYFPTWGFHFGDHCSEWTLVKEYEQRLKIFASYIGKNITKY